MRFLFCADPFAQTKADPTFEHEVAAVAHAGIEYNLLNIEQLVDDRNPSAAIRRVRPSDQPELMIYRGWMLRPEQYTQLYSALQSKGLALINDPAAYRHCHFLPESYNIIQSATAQTVWTPYDANVSIEQIMALLTPFADRPVILKDYVKSRKHEWHEACYIPAANDRVSVERVVNCFVARQGQNLNEGLVFREYTDFWPIGNHSQSGMPLTLEYRCFILDGKILSTSPYWEGIIYQDFMPSLDLFAEHIAQVQSRFFTMDIAQRTDGSWMIVELGDGQVAGLPETLDPAYFYKKLLEQL